MREIKFRGFNKNTQRMIDLKSITPLALDPILNQDGLFLPFDADFELMQFTGLHDKNGKEIYEGDIVRCEYDGLLEALTVEGVVEINPYRVMLDFPHLGQSVSLEAFDSSTFEVIGNIYEHGNLLGADYGK